jgi:hypothetical protein
VNGQSSRSAAQLKLRTKTFSAAIDARATSCPRRRLVPARNRRRYGGPARLERRVTRPAVAAAVVAAALAGCAAEVYTVNPAQEMKYDRLWAADWHRIVIDERPFIASASSPGVCNIGGTKQGCYDADLTLIADFRKLGADLSGSVVPSEFARANTTLHAGIREFIRALSDRNDAIASGNPNATLTQSNNELAVAQRTFEQAFAEYKGAYPPANPAK